MADLSVSETLRSAATRLRSGTPLVSPAVAEPLARMLERQARSVLIDWVTGGATSNTRKYIAEEYGDVVTLARTILDGQP